MAIAPTIIVFVREPRPGRSKTRLIPALGSDGAALVAHAFAVDAVAKAATLGVPVVIAGDAKGGVHQSRFFGDLARNYGTRLLDQSAGDLGERMADAISSYAPAGAVLIGTDTPTLPVSILRVSVAALRRHSIVLGPTLDGGYYLIGVRGDLPPIFSSMRWGGRQVFSHTLARLDRAALAYKVVAGWYDIDRGSDLPTLRAHLRWLAKRPNHPCPATAAAMARLGPFPARGYITQDGPSAERQNRVRYRTFG
jgi:rSAM/selenodomain-associated transferase 1